MTESVHPNAARIKLGLFAGAVTIIAAVFAILFTGGSDDGTVETALQGDPAPTVELVYLEGGSELLSDLSGTPVVLNFFADWCPACVAEMPDFERVHQQFGDDVMFIGIDRSGSDDGARSLIEQTGITYQVAVDRDGSMFQAFNGLAMPTTVFIGADGSIVDQHNGVIFEADLVERINSVFFGA